MECFNTDFLSRLTFKNTLADCLKCLVCLGSLACKLRRGNNVYMHTYGVRRGTEYIPFFTLSLHSCSNHKFSLSSSSSSSLNSRDDPSTFMSVGKADWLGRVELN